MHACIQFSQLHSFLRIKADERRINHARIRDGPWANPVAGPPSGLAGGVEPPVLGDGGGVGLGVAALEAGGAAGVVVDAAAGAVPVARLHLPAAAHGRVVRPFRAQLRLAAPLARVPLAEVEVLARPAAPVPRLPAHHHFLHISQEKRP